MTAAGCVTLPLMSAPDPNPYAAPGTEVRDPVPPPGSPVKAVALGLVTDIGGTFLGSIVLSIIYSLSLGASGATEAQVREAMEAGAGSGSWVWLVGMAMGCGFSVAGGYVCTRISRRSDFVLPCILAVLSIGIGLLMETGSTQTSDVTAMMSLATLLAVLGGAKLGQLRNRRPQ